MMFLQACRSVGLLLPLLLLVQSNPIPSDSLPIDCEDIFINESRHDGYYTIYPFGEERPLEVYCDMSCDEDESHESQRGQWTVIQRRFDGILNFVRPYEQYISYFGVKDGEYWLGLQNMHLLTWGGRYALQVDVEDYDGGRASALYNSFMVESETHGFKLSISEFTNLGAGDALARHNGAMFSSFDKDQDGNAYRFWGAGPNGGFWYHSGYDCCQANVNGLYKYKIDHAASKGGIFWSTWSASSSLKAVTMKIRRRPIDELLAETE
ncbi:microfibril-associated glycoprotein 4-like [Engraulis encrasicolus]|uniref:microfibril-associated glycoprotein 4-like n=1 Tax=Engraulis encrasicolus TaxID=184585 RepID=UPI002FCF9450